MKEKMNERNDQLDKVGESEKKSVEALDEAVDDAAKGK